MSASFDWDFSDESEKRGKAEIPDADGRNKRWLRRGGAVLVLLAVASLAVGMWVHGRLQLIEKREAELRTLVQLELRTIADGDMELFRSLQDPANPGWRARQLARYISDASGEFTPAPGLERAVRPVEIEAVHLFGGTGRAELTQWYRTPAANVPGQENTPGKPHPFHVTWFYRQHEDGTWYHTAPPDDYWGVPYSWHGSRLVIRATEVESAQIDPIADKLAAFITRACRWVGCPQGKRYTLDFLDTLAPAIQEDWWTLPALHLVGVPDDPAARQIWEEALERWTLTALARAQVDDASVTERIIYQQLVDRLQAGFGLAEPAAPDLDLLQRALSDGSGHPVWSLWEAKPDPDDPTETRLLETEVAVLLSFLDEQVLAERVLALLPALDQEVRLGDALERLYDLELSSFNLDWLEYLADMTGVMIARPPAIRTLSSSDFPPYPPPTPEPPATPPGDQFALNCDGQVWIGDADGSEPYPLTVPSERFGDLLWSPDGDRLATTWQPRVVGGVSLLYELNPDGSGGRLRTLQPGRTEWPVAWSPDGRELIYYSQSTEPDYTVSIQSLDVTTGITQTWPGVPVWSPDGRHLVYDAFADDAFAGSVWLADGDWGNPREILTRGWIWAGEVWSPDGSRVALVSQAKEEADAAIVLYDLETDQFSHPITAQDLTTAVLDAEKRLVSDATDPTLLAQRPLRWLWIWGWSADGTQLLVAGRPDFQASSSLVALLALPAEAFEANLAGTDDPQAKVLAYGRGKQMTAAAWSPTEPDLLTFGWFALGGGGLAGPETYFETYLVSLQANVILAKTNSYQASWSPDGRWIGLVGLGRAQITDPAGREHLTFTVSPGELCSDLAWNPTVELQTEPLGRTIDLRQLRRAP